MCQISSIGWGAAADVPKKFGKLAGSELISLPKKVVLVPSGATISGFRRSSGVALRVLDVLKRIRVGPAGE